jgi:hypothetical protein
MHLLLTTAIINGVIKSGYIDYISILDVKFMKHDPRPAAMAERSFVILRLLAAYFHRSIKEKKIGFCYCSSSSLITNDVQQFF